MRYADTAPTLNYSVGESALAPAFTQSGSFLQHCTASAAIRSGKRRFHEHNLLQ